MSPDQRDQHDQPVRVPDILPSQDAPTDGSVLVVKRHTAGPLTVPTSPVRTPLKKSHLRWSLWIVLSLIATAVASWYWFSSEGPLIRYKSLPVDRGTISASVTATGTVNPVVSVQVGSQVSGIVQRLYVDFNSVVTEGQLVAQIDPEPFQARVNQARASLKTARGNLDKARTALAQRKLERDRMVTLRRQEFVAQSDLDLAKTNYRDAVAQVEVAEAQVDQAQATLASAGLDLGHTRIYSPVNGIVVSRNVDVGQTVAASLQAPTLYVIAQDLTQMQVDANVSESDIGGVTEGKEVEFTVDAYPTAPFKGAVVQVRNAPISIQNVVTYDVVIGVANRDLKLKPGMTANVAIVTSRKDGVLRVPNTALRFRMPGAQTERKKSQVWVTDAAGHIRPVQVQTGIADSTFTEITEGELTEGIAVVVGIETAGDKAQEKLPPGFDMGPKIR